MNPWVLYSMARLAMFVASLGIIYVAGGRGVWALALAAIVSMLLSYVLLRPLRDKVVVRLEARTARRLERHAPGGDEAYEDAIVDSTVGAEPDVTSAPGAGKDDAAS